MTPARPATLHDDSGIVLVAVIWLLALLGGLAMAMSIYTTNAVTSIDTYADRPRAAAAIQAGLNRAVARILVVDPPVPGAESVAVGGARVSASWVNETARIDVNLAPAELLTGLFVRLGASPDAAGSYAATLVALRGQPVASQQAGSGQPVGYNPNEETADGIAAAARGGQPRPGETDAHKPFVDAIQLRQVPGLPPGLMARAAPYLTTFSGVAGIDARWAAPELIEALPGMTRERVRAALESRDASKVGGSMADALGPAKAFTTEQPAKATRVKVTARLADGFTASAEIVIVAYADDREAYRVLSWDDDVNASSAPGKDSSP